MMMMTTTTIQTMSMVSVIAAIFVSISLSTAIVVAVICCRRTGSADPRRRRRRRAWLAQQGRGGYAATADVVVACEMEEFDATSFDQCSLSTTVDGDVRPSPRPPGDDGKSGPTSSTTRQSLTTGLTTSRRSRDPRVTRSGPGSVPVGGRRVVRSTGADCGSSLKAVTLVGGP